MYEWTRRLSAHNGRIILGYYKDQGVFEDKCIQAFLTINFVLYNSHLMVSHILFIRLNMDIIPRDCANVFYLFSLV